MGIPHVSNAPPLTYVIDGVDYLGVPTCLCIWHPSIYPYMNTPLQMNCQNKKDVQMVEVPSVAAEIPVVCCNGGVELHIRGVGEGEGENSSTLIHTCMYFVQHPRTSKLKQSIIEVGTEVNKLSIMSRFQILPVFGSCRRDQPERGKASRPGIPPAGWGRRASKRQIGNMGYG